MPASITNRAKRGAFELVDELAAMLQKVAAEKGPETPLAFSNTSYYLPIFLGITGKAVEDVSDLDLVLDKARALLNDEEDGGTAALLAAEALEALRSLEGPSAAPEKTNAYFSGAIDDLQTRTWGVQLADGRMPGIALLMGSAKNSAVAAELIHELRRHNILCFLSSDTSDQSIISQLQEEGIQLGEGASIIPLGTDASSAAHAPGFMIRSAMKLGGHKPGTWPEIVQHCKRQMPGFVLALGELSNEECAILLASAQLGLSVIIDTEAPDGEKVVCVPFDSIAGSDDTQKAVSLVETCIAIRRLKLRSYSVNVPLAYGPAFEEETIADADLAVQFGDQGKCSFELLQTAALDEVSDGKIELIGPDVAKLPEPAYRDLGIVIKVAGKKLQRDYEPLLERQIHSFLNYASGVQHAGREDAISIRVSKAAAGNGFSLETFGKILHARYHEEFAAAVEKVEITFFTEPKALSEWRSKAQEVHTGRSKRLADLTDSQVDVFYVCRNCRSFAPNNVSIISPERVSPCGQCTWLDAKAGFEMHSTGVRRPIKPGKPIDMKKGIWQGLNDYARVSSHGRVQEVALYSIMQSPMCACADFEAIVMVIPETNGVMVLAREDGSPTPAGVNVEIFASIAAGEQIPGVEGIGKSYLLSPKFISAEGGFRRVVWMSSKLKQSMAADLQAVCEREGDPTLMDKIADERQSTTVEDLVTWLKAHNHPAMQMEPMF